MPKLYIIAGPNGAGKTTFAKEFLPNYIRCPRFINADLIANGLSPFFPASAQIKAGRLLLEQINEFIEGNKDFALESTLSGKTYVRLLRKIREQGYFIHIFFLWIPTIQLAKARIKLRVHEGGHDVPGKDIARCFHRSLKNFLKNYKSLSDSWFLFDNSTENPVMIAHEIQGHLNLVNNVLFNKIMGESKQ